MRSKLTYANVISTLCLFLLLGGGAYAAARLAKNSVGTKQIKNKAVTLTKINPAAQTSLKGQTGAQGATGPKGDTGSKGDTGAVGASNSYQATHDPNLALSTSAPSPTTIASLTLPGPATYLVSASGSVFITSGAASDTVSFLLERDGDVVVDPSVTGPGPAPGSPYAMTRLIAVAGASSVISIRAYATTSSGSPFAWSNSLVATLVGSGSGAS